MSESPTYSKRLALSEIGTLSPAEQAAIRQWLNDNYVEPLGCELEELEGGGVVIHDAGEELGADDSAFGVHLVDDSGASFLVVLFEYLPQGIIVDRATATTVADVIEGDITDVADGFDEERAQAIFGAVPV